MRIQDTTAINFLVLQNNSYLTTEVTCKPKGKHESHRYVCHDFQKEIDTSHLNTSMEQTPNINKRYIFSLFILELNLNTSELKHEFRSTQQHKQIPMQIAFEQIPK